MEPTPRLSRLEWMVEDLDALIELLSGALGFQPISRGRHETLDAEVAVLATEGLEFWLVRPTSTGQGQPIREPQPCMIQLVFEAVDERRFEALRQRLITSGASVSDDGPGELHLARTMVQDLLGDSPVLTFITATDDHALPS